MTSEYFRREKIAWLATAVGLHLLLLLALLNGCGPDIPRPVPGPLVLEVAPPPPIVEPPPLDPVPTEPV